MERGKRSILVVDSSASSVFYLSMLLKQFGYAVRSALTGEDALGSIVTSAPAVVIADAVLPKMSGLELLRQIKNHASLRFIPVIILSADLNPALKETCMQAGCAGYFRKSVEPEALYRAIQTSTEATPRRHIRITTMLKALIGSGISGMTAEVEEVISLSEGGLYVNTISPADVNSLVSLTLFLRNRKITATAVVLSSSAQAGGLHAVPGMALKFTNISEDDINLIRDFIKDQVIRDLEGRKGVNDYQVANKNQNEAIRSPL